MSADGTEDGTEDSDAGPRGQEGMRRSEPTFSELLRAVMLGDLHLVHLVFTDEGSHFGEALSAGPPHTHQ